jgi:predicted GNAT family N-acyltransferase
MNFQDLKLIIDKPANLSQTIKDQVLHLVTLGEQVKPAFAKVGIHRAELIGVVMEKDLVISTCCLKNPTANYRDSVFAGSKCVENPEDFTYELGYIATYPGHEGKGFCQRLLKDFFPLINQSPAFATTRKASMAHILGKYGFVKTGEIFKNDLELLVFKTT